MRNLIILMLLMCGLFVQAQKKTDAMLFGDVKDENGNHVPFANIIVKGTTLGTVADETGHFMMTDLPVGKQTIVCHMIGYKSQEKTVEMKAYQSTEIFFRLKKEQIELNQVVVSADRMQTKRKEAPVIVNVISPKTLQEVQSTTLMEGINYSPGLRVENDCQNCGFSQLRMNGLDGPYTQILIDSRPVFSGLAGVYGLEQIPVNMIKQIEVVRGGGSALFGGNAIGGTVNIITKEPENNSFSLSTNTGLIGVNKQINQPKLDNNVSFNGTIVKQNRKAGFTLYGMSRNRQALDVNNDRFSDIPLLKTDAFGLNSFYKLSAKTKAKAGYYHVHDFRRGGNKLDYLPQETDITEQVEHYIDGGDVSLQIYTAKNKEDNLNIYIAGQHILRNSYYGANYDPSAYGKTTNLTTSTGIQYVNHQQNLVFAPAIFTIGVDNNYSHLIDEKLGINGNANTYVANQALITNGLFAQNEWKINKFKTTLGVRYDNYKVLDFIDESLSGNVIGSVVVPRVNLLYSPVESTQFRVSYSRGYRAPQIFDEDLHIESSGARRIKHINAPDLRQETSDNITSSVEWNHNFNRMNVDFLCEGFYTYLHNPFATQISDLDSLGNMIYTRFNAVYGAIVQGLNFQLNIAPNYSTRLQLGFTVQKSNYNQQIPWGNDDTKTTDEILRTPHNYGYLIFSYNPKNTWKLSISGIYTGRMYVPHFGMDPNDPGLTAEESATVRQMIQNGDIIQGEELIETHPFFDMGTKVSYLLKLKANYYLQFNLGVKNIFNSFQTNLDKGKYRDAGFIYGTQIPRSVYFGLKISI